MRHLFSRDPRIAPGIHTVTALLFAFCHRFPKQSILNMFGLLVHFLQIKFDMGSSTLVYSSNTRSNLDSASFKASGVHRMHEIWSRACSKVCLSNVLTYSYLVQTCSYIMFFLLCAGGWGTTNQSIGSLEMTETGTSGMLRGSCMPCQKI